MSKLERDKQKLIQDKCQQILTELLRDEDNKYCVDCDSKGPRWASWNLGIFLCIRCAGIHRNLGVHISRVKSVNLDSWTPEQVGSIQNMGNSKARAVYEANLPDNFTRPQTDSALETFIRSKYEHKKYIAKEWVETTPKPAFDVDTELKKEKEKKKGKANFKSISPIGAQTEIQSNPIPRPSANVNVNGKSEKVASISGSQQKTDSSNSATTDLLGLDLMSSANDEPFGFFTSADSSKKEDATSQQPKDSKTIEDEEKDFFSQKAPEKSEEKKFTMESILSLYSQAPASNPLNGFTAQPVNTLNQFPGNAPFGAPTGPKLANPVISSTNPFLASNNNSNVTTAFMPSDFSQQPLVQGLSSLQLNPNPNPQIPSSNPAPINAQNNLNWFSSVPVATNSLPLSGQQSSLANPFVDSNSSFNAFATGNILNFDLKPNGSRPTGINSTNPASTNSQINNQKDTGSNSFW